MRVILKNLLPIFAFALLILISPTAIAQSPQDPQPDGPPPNGPPPNAVDLIPRLNLTQDQIRSIRIIQRDGKDERAALGMRLREANRALDMALDADILDENLIQQRIQELSTAQSAQLRHRIQTEIRIRRVLTPEQLVTLRDLKLKAGDVIRARQNERRPNRPAADSFRPNQRNGVAPLNRPNQSIRRPRP